MSTATLPQTLPLFERVDPSEMVTADPNTRTLTGSPQQWQRTYDACRSAANQLRADGNHNAAGTIEERGRAAALMALYAEPRGTAQFDCNASAYYDYNHAATIASGLLDREPRGNHRHVLAPPNWRTRR